MQYSQASSSPPISGAEIRPASTVDLKHPQPRLAERSSTITGHDFAPGIAQGQTEARLGCSEQVGGWGEDNAQQMVQNSGLGIQFNEADPSARAQAWPFSQSGEVWGQFPQSGEALGQFPPSGEVWGQTAEAYTPWPSMLARQNNA